MKDFEVPLIENGKVKFCVNNILKLNNPKKQDKEIYFGNYK